MEPSPAPRRRAAATAVLGFLGVMLLAVLGGITMAAFTGWTASGSTLALASLDDWLPSSVTTSRITATTCQVSWTPHGAAPVGATYDISDGTSTLSSDVAGTTTVVTTGAGAVTPVVKLRVGTWVSATGTSAASACLGRPDAPTLTLTPSEGQIAATWTDPAGNGGTVASYAASISPAGTGTTSCSVLVPASRSCVFTGLTDGVEYTVSVTATSGEGTGPAGTATAIPYPSTVMTGPALKLWLDGSDTSTVFASSTCAGASASSTVGCWADKSGNGNNATQPTGSLRPGLSTVSGHSVPDLDGTDDWLALDPSLLPTGSAPSTILADARTDDADPSNTTHGMIVTWGTASPGQARGLWKGWFDDSVFASVWSGTGTSQGHWVTGAPQVAAAQHVTPAVTVWANGTGVGATSSVDGPFSTGATAAAVGQFDSSYFWNGAIPEVIVFQSALSDADRRTVEEYLARKWGSTITPRVPTGVVLSPTAAGTSAEVAWTAPSWNGGSVVTGYTVTAVPTAGGGDVTCTAVHPSTSCTLSGLAGGGAQYTVTVTAANAAGTGPASAEVSLFAGLPVTADLKLWLDGGDAASLYASSTCTGSSATTTVGCWKDKSGQAAHAVQAASGERPALVAFAGHTVPEFDGVDDGLSVDGSLLPTGTADSTIAAAATLTDPLGHTPYGFGAVISWGAAVDGQMRQLLQHATTTTVRLDTHQGGLGVTDGAWSASAATVAVGEHATGTTLQLWTDGTGASTATGSFTTTGTAAAVGRKGTAVDASWNGPIQEVIVTGGLLSAAERRQVEEYLARKWGGIITPAAPTAATATPGNGGATVSWTAPSFNGGDPVTSYTVTPVGGPGSCTWSAGTSASCTGLTNGTPYTFTVAATNAVGTGPATTTASVTPSGTPGAPTAVAVVPGDTTASVSWTPPAPNGTSAITSYTATAVPSDGALPTVTCSSASSPCTLSGLTNGVTYTVSVTATNSGGTGSASTSTTGMPYPALLTSANAQLWLDGTDVDGDGVSEGSTENCETATACVATGNVLTRWEDRSGRNHDAVQSTGAMAGTYTPATGLVSFTANGYYQAASIATGPDATAFAVASSATSTWNTYGWLMTGRAANGWVLHPNNGASNTHFMGITNTGYNVQTTVTGDLTPVTAITNPHIWDGWITGSGSQTLNHGVDGAIGATASSATVRAAASVTVTIGADDFDLAARRGSGSFRELVAFDRALTAAERRSVTEYLARKWSVPVTPSAPQSASATVGNTTATVSWSAPAWTGGANVTSYTVTPAGGPGSCTWSSGTTASCTGLTNGTPYTFTVAAVNSVGTGPTATTASVTPYTVPGAPTGVAATADDTVSSVSWSAPASDGGSAITSYTATAVPSDGTLPTRTCSSATSPCSLSGLTNGVTYTVTVAATNVAGAGSSSSSTTVLPYPAGVMSASALKLWLDAATPSTVLASSGCTGAAATTTVSCWKDRSTAGNNAVVVSTGTASVGTTMNGRATVAFGSASRLSVPRPTSGDMTYLAVLRTTQTRGTSSSQWWAGTTIFDADVLGATGDFGLSLTGGYPAFGIGNPDTTAHGPSTVNDGVGHLVTGLRSAGSVEASADDATRGSAAGGSSAALTGTTTGYLGLNADGNNYVGDLAEVVGISSALSRTEQRQVAEYLARKWGLTITPGAPVSPSASASGSTATVSWSAPTWNGGAAVSSYTVSTTGGKTCTTSGTSCQITGLVADATYTFTVTATNSVGTGPGSTASVTMPSPAQPIDTFELSVWGYGASGRTGVLMQSSTTSSAVRMPGPETWASVSAGHDHTCGITTGGALYCWGSNGNGELGLGDLTQRWEPVQVSAGTTWSSVSAGQDNTCAIKASDSSLWCWGYYGATNLTTPTAVSTTGVTTWSTVTVGIQFACGLKTDGTLWCLGNGANGRLGNGSTATQTSPVQVSVGTTFSRVTAGEQHACAIRSSDSVLRCWGDNGNGRLGDGTTTQANSPVTVSGGLQWADVSAGESATCGVTTGGALYCWGWDGFGQLANGASGDSTTPVRESTAATDWQSVAATFGSTMCGVKASGRLYCWGYNGQGSIGDGTTTDRDVPTASGSITDWTGVSGGDWQVCGIRSDQAIWCQGYDANGELGQQYGTAVGSPTPVIPFDGPWISGSAAYEGGCAVQSDGTLWCWGVNSNGWNGTGNTTQHNSPVQAGSATSWRTVSVGIRTACGIRDDGTLYCWGYATDGQTGVSGASGNVTSPTAGPSDLWSDVSVGETHACGITTLGLLHCWGENSSGQLGQGDTTNQPTPVAVTATGVSTWSEVSAGYYGTCAIAATGANAGGLYCWGMNASGQVGNGGTTVQKSPVQVGSATWSHVASGRQHTCGVRTNGTLWCWGINNLGQLGGGGTAGSPATATSPQQVGTGTTWSTVGAGYEFSCATKNDGTLWCWGRNDLRQVADRTTTTRTSPVQVSGYTGSLQEVHGSAMIALAGG